ncbi:MAG: M14 family zinc carboxypeptidase [Fuerstiella sp.]
MTSRWFYLIVILWTSGEFLSAADPVRPERVHRITLEEYEATLKFWDRKHADVCQLERIGESAAGLGLYLLRVTDPEVNDDFKQVALVTSLHGGPERSGTTTVLHFVEWLLGDSEEARESLRKQVLLIMPVNHPEAFFQTDRFRNSEQIDPYTGGGPQHWDMEKLEFKSPDKAPEVKAVLEVVDRWHPDVHADMHGTGLQEYPLEKLGDRTRYQGQTMFEVTGSAYSNYALRPWDWRVTEAMIRAGEDAGFPSDRFEADGQRCFHGPVMNPIADRTWSGQPNFYTAQYGYAKYHTMVSALEVGWEESGVARLKGLLRIGNSHWQNEPHEGYPVDRVKSFVGNFVTSSGSTAAARRHSRVNLWQQQGRFTQAILYPQTDGRATYFVATSASAGACFSRDIDEFLANVTTRDDVDADAFQKLVRSGPEVLLAIDKARVTKAVETPLEHGIGFRLRLPYRNPTIDSVRVNGHQLDRSSSHGWQSWFANGFTQVQINIPPQVASQQDLFAISCEYTPDVVRRIGWTPPPEVRQQLGQ